ncbi:hypothetical protein PRZ48_002019 [Zasmidium cellare]|uniref:Uncharacterized protein n=1 Tax=Zasmidium cellare TaxID=395010 RepID=A0ABR0F4P6_ZASCE|nr:hypothetical protein PRZ48_002019 [Zasmidium cellare]
MEVPIPLTNPQYKPAGELAGLGASTTPSTAREALKGGFVAALTYGQIKQHLRMAASTLFTHQKLAVRYHYRVKGGANTLVFFLCGSHGFQAIGDDEELPRLGEVQMLPMGCWESLYLALVSEVRALYSDIRLHFTGELGRGELVLHTRGASGMEEDKPFTAFDLGSQLEEMWHLLMDARLVGPLEKAVRLENASEQYRAHYGNSSFREYFQNDFYKLEPKDMDAKLDAIEGMVNQADFSSHKIDEMLWQKHADLLSRACREHLHIEVDLVSRRAQLREAATIPTPAAATHEEPFCVCPKSCLCQQACAFEIDTCACACKSRRMAPGPMSARGKTPTEYFNQDVYSPEQPQPQPSGFPSNEVGATPDDYFGQVPHPSERQQSHPVDIPANEVGRITNSMATMQMSGVRSPEHRMLDSYMSAREAARSTSQQTFRSRRGRAGTENSELAYVPETQRRATRGRDAIPLALYGNELGERYPPFHSTAARSPEPIPNYTTTRPTRKPLPAASGPAPPLPEQRSDRMSPEAVPTMTISSSSPEPEALPTRPSRRFLTGFVKRLAKDTADPNQAQEELRQPDDGFDKWDTSHIKTPVIPAQEGVTAAGERYHSPMGRHSADSPILPDRRPSPATTIGRSNTVDPAQLELPEFIAPRPATQQRYVKAGGNAKLEDRESLKNLNLPEAAEPGFSMRREDFMRQLDDAQIGTPPRTSETTDSAPRTSTNSNADSVPRSSNDTALGSGSSTGARPSNDVPSERSSRGRTTSGTSNRGLRRLFSRNNSSTE